MRFFLRYVLSSYISVSCQCFSLRYACRRNDNGVINHALHNENYSPSLGDLFPLIMVYLSKLVSFFPSWQGQKHLAHCKSGMSISTKQLWSSKMNFFSTTTYRGFLPYATFGTWKKTALAKNRISKIFILCTQ